MLEIFGELKGARLVLAAVSGGADSVYLLHSLVSCAEQADIRIAVIHVNHNTRGAASDGDEEFVRKLAGRLELPFYVRRLEAASREDAPSLANEGDLRSRRLAALKAVAREIGASAIAFGHHRDDLAETFLLNALRGSGPAGLEGMRPQRRLNDGLLLIRPLLDMRRTGIEEWLMAHGEAWREDASNDDKRHRRNRIRNEVIPLLEAIEPGAVPNLATSAIFSGEAYEFLLEQTAAAADECLLASSPVAILFSSTKAVPYACQKFGPGMIRNYFRRLIAGMEAETPALPNRDVIRRIVQRLSTGTGEEATFHLNHNASLLLTNRYGLLHYDNDLLNAALSVASGFSFSIAPPGTASAWKLDELRAAEGIPIFLPGWSADIEVTVEERILSADAYVIESPLQQAAHFDIDAIRGDLQLRILDPGERLPLLGGGSKTVRSCLQEAGVPPRLRHFVTGFADDEGILWIPGVRRTARAWIADSSQRVLSLRLAPKTNSANRGNLAS